jgi:hypothetical protein
VRCTHRTLKNFSYALTKQIVDFDNSRTTTKKSFISVCSARQFVNCVAMRTPSTVSERFAN